MALDLFNAMEADTLGRVLRQQLSDQVLCLHVQVRFGEDNLMAFLDVVVGLGFIG